MTTVNVLSLDDVLRVERPAFRFPFTMSADQRWVAFTAAGHDSKQANLGVSDEAEGCTQWVCHVESGKAYPLVPEANSSWSGTWSPNGEILAFFSDLEGKAQLWLWNSEDQSISLASERIVRPFFGFEKPIWTNDGKSIIVKSMPQGYVNSDSFNPNIAPANEDKDPIIKVYSTDMDDHQIEQGNDSQGSFIERYHADIIRIDWETKEHTIIASNHYPVGISLSSDGQKIAFTSCRGLEKINYQQVIYNLWIAPVYPNLGEKEQVDCLQKGVRMSYGLSFVWGKDNKTIYYTTEGPLSDEGLWQIYTDDIGGSKQLFQQDQLSFKRDHEAPFVLPNGDLLLTASGKLWRYVHSSGEMIELSTQIQKHVITFLPTIIDTSESINKQYVLVQTKDHQKQQWGFVLLNIESGEIEKVMEESSQHTPWYWGGACVNRNSDKDMPIVVYFAESSSEAPNLRVWNLETNEAKKVTDLTSFSHSIGETKVLTWNRDGKEVKGVLLLPSEQKGKIPVILDVYAGEKVTGSINTFGLHDSPVDNRHLFSSRGYAVFVPELPIDSNEPADEIEKGLVAALEELAKYPGLDMDRLGIMGHSFGGYTTLVGITRLHEKFKVAITFAGVGNLISQTTHFDPQFNNFNYDWAEHGQANMGVSIWENKERYIRNSPIFDFDKIESPVLIVQGTKDSLCSNQAGPIFSALKRLGKTAELALYEGDHWHGTWRSEDVKDYYCRVFGWLEKYL